MQPPLRIGDKVRLKIHKNIRGDVMTVKGIDGDDVVCLTEDGTQCVFPDNILELVEWV